MKVLILYISIFSLSLSFLAQEDKGDNLMKSNYYSDAIKAYRKALKKTETGILYQKMGKAYLFTKDYIKADKCYTAAMSFNDNNDSTLFEFAKALLTLNHKKEAKKYFDKYKKSYPNDYLAIQYINLYDSSILKAISQPNFIVNAISGQLNTIKSEFGARPYKNGIIYVTEGTKDLVNNEINTHLNSNYYSIYFSKKNGEYFEKGKLFNSKINSDWHNGSIAITPDGNEIYYTQTFRNRKTEVIQLFSCKIENGKLAKPKPFEYNNKEYSIMHPCFSDDGKTLFFSSNKKKGKGGLDIYYSIKDRKYGWTAPKPINGRINTAGNEVFPFYKNGTLYFSSDGHFGEGGLDIFSATENDYYSTIQNLGLPINSSKDDFSICYDSINSGYFSSDRLNGKGKDDIYRFVELKKLIKVDSSASITGIFEFNKLGMPNQELILLNEYGEEVDRIITDENGRFIFRQLKSGAKYTILPVEEQEDTDLFLTNSNGEKILLVEKIGQSFTFKTLNPSYTETLLTIEEEDPSFLIIPVKGFVFNKLKGDLNKRIELKVYDDNHHLIGRTYTNKDGTFIFKTLIPQNNYYFELEEQEDLHLIIINRNNEDQETLKQENGSFLYQRIQSGEDGLLLVNENNDLIRIRQNEMFSIDNILYSTNSSELNIAAITQLNKLYIMYRKNIHLTFTIESHTDSRGSDKYNLKLSERRAKKVIDYLIKKGIPKDHLTAIGYGETKLKNKCKNGVICSDDEHAINRRTEIKLKGKKTKF